MNTEPKNTEISIDTVLLRLSQFCDKLEDIDQKVIEINEKLTEIHNKFDIINLSLDSIIFKMEENNQSFDD